MDYGVSDYWRKAVLIYGAALVHVIFPVSAEAQGQTGRPVINLDYIYHKDRLGIDPVTRYLPSGTSWSPSGHQLIYRQETSGSGKLLVWMHPGTREASRAWSPGRIQDCLESLEKDGAEGCEPDFDMDSFIPESPDMTPDAKDSEREDGHQDAADAEDDSESGADRQSGFSARWDGFENHVIIGSQGKTLHLDPASGRMWKPDTASTDPEFNGSNLSSSPDGRFEAMTRDGDIHVFDRRDRREIRLTHDGGRNGILNGVFPWVYWEELMWRSTYQAYDWSPDASRIAFFQFDETGTDTYPITDFSSPVPATSMESYPKAGNRNPTIRAGIVSLSSRHTTWVELPDLHEYLIHIKWAPDGRSFYLQGLNRMQNHLCLYRVDAETGRGSLVLEESSDTWVNTFNMPLVLETPQRSDQIVWLSERTGYNHLYLISENGRRQKALTSGDWEVLRRGFGGRQVSYHPLRDRVYFSAREQGPLERHYYSLSLQDGTMKRLTTEPGNHSINWSNDGEFGIDSWTSETVPRVLEVIDADGNRVHLLGRVTMDDFRPYEIRVPELVGVQDEDGNVFHGSILKPADFDPVKKYPVVAYVYGEPAGQVVSRSFVSDWDMVLSNHGFVVFRFDARGTPGRGRPWLDPVYQDQMTIPMQDWRLAAGYLRSLDYVDGSRLGVWGWSGGGTMTLNLMLRTPGLFQAGAAVAAVTDKALYDTIYTERYLRRPQDNPEGYKKSSPLHAAENLQGDLLIAHGISDDNVHVQNAYNLLTALNRANKPYELFLYPQKGHGIGGSASREHLYSRILAFFIEHLQPGEPR